MKWETCKLIGEKIAKLIDVKTIVTFTVIGVFAHLAVTGRTVSQEVMIIVTAIITYFFSRQKDSPS